MNVKGLLTIGLEVHGNQASDYEHHESRNDAVVDIAKLGQDIPFNSAMHKIVKYFCYQNFHQNARTYIKFLGLNDVKSNWCSPVSNGIRQHFINPIDFPCVYVLFLSFITSLMPNNRFVSVSLKTE